MFYADRSLQGAIGGRSPAVRKIEHIARACRVLKDEALLRSDHPERDLPGMVEIKIPVSVGRTIQGKHPVDMRFYGTGLDKRAKSPYNVRPGLCIIPVDPDVRPGLRFRVDTVGEDDPSAAADAGNDLSGPLTARGEQGGVELSKPERTYRG